ncbi:MAG: tetratricopeptide repeat protein [Oceanococcus sp.]|nr:MAG: tetratricopeptide repeat protein [Oceanococcus sp.]
MPTTPSYCSVIRLGSVGLASMLLACASHAPLPHQSTVAPESLIAEAPQSLAQTQVKADEILATTPEMREFVARHVDLNARPGQRLEQLIHGMLDEQLLALEFELGRTRTAAQTFEDRRGNCLSFTNLFVALAREAGLLVNYQLIDVPASWERNGDWVVVDNHINAILHNLRVDGSHRWNYVVDFNMADFQGHYPREEIDDARAFALFFNNRGAEFMQRGHLEQAHSHLAQAHALNPRLPALWLNLGSLYRKQGQHEQAKSAYLEALRLDPHAPAALSNLASLYRSLGKTKQALQVERRLSQLREQDPYYFYQRSLTAYSSGQWLEATRHLDQALRLKKDEHQFIFLRALLELQQGQIERARTSLEQAQSLASNAQTRALYSSKIHRLSSESHS